MSEYIYVFKRTEKKYLLKRSLYDEFFNNISSHLISDGWGRKTVFSLYLDTDNYRIIRTSIEAPNYKEKIRVRSYGIPDESSDVFFELKKKCDGVVYKRRAGMSLSDAEKYISDLQKPYDSQIMREIDYSMKFYSHPTPKVAMLYEREAFLTEDDPEFRITFDESIRYRTTDFYCKMPETGKKIISDDEVLMEIKTPGAIPLWLSSEMDKLKIYPTSFSKYGTAYTEIHKNTISANAERKR